MTKVTEYGRVLDVSETIKLQNSLGQYRLTAYLIEEKPTSVATHVSLAVGEITKGMLVRINSACATSEIFACNRCDCYWQLWQAMSIMQERGQGLLTYHANHEGRGSGLFHKINSYALMDRTGCSTAEAFYELGLPLDVRNFNAATLILRHLGLRSVRLLSNNPAKAEALETAGIEVTHIEPLVPTHQDEWRIYLESKRRDFGHVIDLHDGHADYGLARGGR